jgi:hypothetical protein
VEVLVNSPLSALFTPFSVLQKKDAGRLHSLLVAGPTGITMKSTEDGVGRLGKLPFLYSNVPLLVVVAFEVCVCVNLASSQYSDCSG